MVNKSFEYDNITKTLIIPSNFNAELKKEDFPIDVLKIFFKDNCKFNYVLKENIFPKSLKHLYFHDQYRCVLNQGTLPENLLTLCYSGVKIKKGVLPNTLTKIILSYFYNYEIKEDVLPKSLKYLELGDFYDYEIKKNVLPEGLIYLKIGYHYNKSIEYYPSSLTTIQIFGSKYNRFVLNNLPNTIEILTIVNLEIALDNLPFSLKKIKFINYDKEKYILLKKIPFGCVLSRFINSTNECIIDCKEYL